jgi:hypothetical protein
MPSFSQTSAARLATCDPRLQQVFNAVVREVDCTVLVGHRNQADQEKAFAEGKSQKHWPEGEHNAQPSRAVDVVPVVPAGLDVWNVKDPAIQIYWWKLQYGVMRKAETLGIKVRWGLDWNSDGNTADTKLKDWPHWEVEP